MKKIIFTLVAMFAIATNANAMSYEQARNEALFLTDKMAYELNLSDSQYEAAYEINLDYLMGVTSRDNVFGTYWERRNADLNYILYSWQWALFRAAAYFYRPLYWDAGYWHFRVYTRYPHRSYFYFGRPHFYDTYRGGHGWRYHSRSYYAHHHTVYRPHNSRDHHFGMRDGWNRGDYRGHDGNHRSSTHITGHDAHRGNNHGGINNSGRTSRPSDGTSRRITDRAGASVNNRHVPSSASSREPMSRRADNTASLSSGSVSRSTNSVSNHSSSSVSNHSSHSSSTHSSGSFSRSGNSSSSHSSGNFSRGGSSRSSHSASTRSSGSHSHSSAGSGRSGGRR